MTKSRYKPRAHALNHFTGMPYVHTDSLFLSLSQGPGSLLPSFLVQQVPTIPLSMSPTSQGQNGLTVKEQSDNVVDESAGESYLGNIVYVPCPWNCPSFLLLYVPALIRTSVIRISSMSTLFTKTEYVESRD